MALKRGEQQALILFLVTHEHRDPWYDDDDITEVKFIGVYSSKILADEAVQRLRTRPGFAESAEGFCIDAVQVDQTSWEDGFDSD